MFIFSIMYHLFTVKKLKTLYYHTVLNFLKDFLNLAWNSEFTLQMAVVAELSQSEPGDRSPFCTSLVGSRIFLQNSNNSSCICTTFSVFMHCWMGSYIFLPTENIAAVNRNIQMSLYQMYFWRKICTLWHQLCYFTFPSVMCRHYSFFIHILVNACYLLSFS